MEAKEFFEYVESLGCNIFPDFDVVHTDDSKYREHYRIYHHDCHCIDIYKVEKEVIEDDSEEFFDYEYHSDLFDGFTPISIDDFYNKIKK